METVIQHTARQGDRWDILAHQYYGDAMQMQKIIEANLSLSLYEVIPTGQLILIPVLKVKPTNNEQMPPWLRGDND